MRMPNCPRCGWGQVEEVDRTEEGIAILACFGCGHGFDASGLLELRPMRAAEVFARCRTAMIVSNTMQVVGVLLLVLARRRRPN